MSSGAESDRVLLFAYLNAFYETGFQNPIDVAIKSYRKLDVSGYQKLGEVPYDFLRKRLSILVSKGDAHFMVTKGTLTNVLDVCSRAERPRPVPERHRPTTAASQVAPAPDRAARNPRFQR